MAVRIHSILFSGADSSWQMLRVYLVAGKVSGKRWFQGRCGDHHASHDIRNTGLVGHVGLFDQQALAHTLLTHARIKQQVPNLPANDPVKEYMMSASERICATLKEEFLPFVPHILPQIIEKFGLSPKEFNSELADTLDEGGEVNLTMVKQDDGKASGQTYCLLDNVMNVHQTTSY